MKKILVPTDFGVFSKEAVKYAAMLTKGYQAELILFHAYHLEDLTIFGTDSINGEHIPGYTQWEAQSQLNELCDLVKKESQLENVKGVLKNGFVFEELVKFSKSENIDFIVMSTGGAKGLARIFGGTMTADVVSTLDCPVLVIPPGYTFSAPTEIVYATDMLNEDPEIMEILISLAKFYNAHLSLLNIIESRPLSFNDTQIHILEEFPVFEDFKNRSYHLLDAEDIVEGIQDFAEFRKAGMIVMASHRKNLIQKIFVGSRTKEMAQVTRIPLLALHKSAQTVKA